MGLFKINIMKKEITKDTYTFLFALFQSYALQHTLDEIEASNEFIREYKKEHNRYCKFLRIKILKILNDMYDNDDKDFQVMEDAITHNAKEFASKGFEEFFTIID